MSSRILIGDCREVLATFPENSVQCCVTSPPYFRLRDYGVVGQLGLESTPDEYVEKMVAVFREVRRVLKDDGTLWINIGDSYWGSGQGWGDTKTTNQGHKGSRERNKPEWANCGLKPKDLIGIPWMLAFALRADGWYLRAPIVWAKPNGMPGSQKDRPTLNYEMLFLFSKSAKYYYNDMAVRQPLAETSIARLSQPSLDTQNGSARANGGAKTNGRMKAVKFGGSKYADRNREEGKENAGNLGAMRDAQRVKWSGAEQGGETSHDAPRERERERERAALPDALTVGKSGGVFDDSVGATLRSVWWIPTEPNKLAHFAIMPEELARRCILLGSKVGDTIMDPFAGAGTTGLVATRNQRAFLGVELNPEYAQMARKRIADDAPLFAEVPA